MQKTYTREWEPNDYLRLEDSDPKLATARNNYVELKDNIEDIDENIPLNLARDITQFQASLWQYIAEIVKFERRKEGDKSIMSIAHLIQTESLEESRAIFLNGYFYGIVPERQSESYNK